MSIIEENDVFTLKESFSKKGVLRGMHWQDLRSPQTKLIKVNAGKILDFVINEIDDRHTLYVKILSPQDGWYAIDEKCSHGFYAIDDTVFTYLCKGVYKESFEKAINIKDKVEEVINSIDIKCNIIQSEKDKDGDLREIDKIIWL